MGKIFEALEKAHKENFPSNKEFEEPFCPEKEKTVSPIIEAQKSHKSEMTGTYSKKQFTIPEQKKYKRKKVLDDSPKAILPHSNILTGEVYRSLANNLLRITQNKFKKSLLIISPNHGDGKTATAINLAIAITDNKENLTLLVESDLRYPDIHKRLGLEQSPGLIDILEGKINLKAGIKDTTKENLKILTSGIPRSHPAELFESKKFKDFICEAKQLFDLIIFDSPPFFIYSDANILRFQVDSVLLVVESGKTTRESLRKIENSLQDKDTEILGIIFNKYPTSKPHIRKQK